MLDSVEQIRTQKLTEIIADKIVDLVKTGVLKPGDKLPSEAELCKKFGVSRSPLREALRSLEYIGLIDSHQGAGRFIARTALLSVERGIDWNDVLRHSPVAELMEARKYVEVLACRLAAQRATEDDISAIEEILGRLEQHHSDQSFYFSEELNLHFAIAAAAKNKPILGFMRALLDEIYKESERFKRTVPLLSEGALSLFKKLVAALKDGDSDGAAGLMLDHLESVEGTLLPDGMPDGK
ncbi:MAG: FadR family transcriptional regulator [Firmicutes bacterium]|jgi:GntR family transcriptional repressor for pyruvate dehydrogenase complex|nr:FadR family transcriptional regulator [Bacillota bacterium]